MINFKKAYIVEIYRNRPFGDDEPYIKIVSDQTNMLRVAFKVRKSNSVYQSGNTMQLSIYNLSQGTRSQINDFNDYVILRAGWFGKTLPIIYQGSSISVNHRISPPNAITQINCLDESASLIALTNTNPKISVNSNISIRSLVENIAKYYRLSVAVNEIPIESILQSGYSSSDKSIKEVLSDLANRADCSISIVDSKIYIYKTSDSELPRGYIDISEENGMIGYPQKYGYNPANPVLNLGKSRLRPSMWRVETQLNGNINIFSGTRLFCPALKINGQEGLVISLEHNCDTHGGSWKTILDTYEKL